MSKSFVIKPPREPEIVSELKRVYLQAERSIIAEITRKRSLQLVDYADVAALKRVQDILNKMTDKVENDIRPSIEEIFYKSEKDLKGYANAMALSTTQTRIVETLVNNYMGLVDEAARNVYGSADKYLRVGRAEADRLQKLALMSVAESEAIGASWKAAQTKMSIELINKGITAFTDIAGRNWNLTAYCNMATRTTAHSAEVAAALTADDWDLWQISKIGSTCKLCSVYEGRVYSKSGTNPDYPPLAMAFGKIDPAGSNDLSNTYLNLHPNCNHTLLRYTTMGKTDKQIERDKEFSSFEKRPANVNYRSKKQIAAYREKEKARAQFRNDRKQFEKYREALGNDMPKTFETFIKHKRLDDDVYKKWESEFRAFNAKTAVNKVPVNKNGNPIEFDIPYKDFGDERRNKRNAERVDSAKQLLTNLSNEYNTELTSVKLASKGNGTRGEVDFTGVMELSNLSPTTTIHEFAHSIAISKKVQYGLTDEKVKEFFEELKKIRKQYTVAWQKGQTKEISAYARKDIDEFFAEAFMHAKIKQLNIELPRGEAWSLGDDYTYSDKVLELVDKFFKK